MNVLHAILLIVVLYFLSVILTKSMERFTPNRVFPYLVIAEKLRDKLATKQIKNPMSLTHITNVFTEITPRTRQNWTLMVSSLNAYGYHFIAGPEVSRKKMYDYFILQLHPWSQDNFDVQTLDARERALVLDIVILLHLFDSDPRVSIEPDDQKKVKDIAIWLNANVGKLYKPFSDNFFQSMQNMLPLAVETLLMLYDNVEKSVLESKLNVIITVLKMARDKDIEPLIQDQTGLKYLQLSEQAVPMMMVLYVANKYSLLTFDIDSLRYLCLVLARNHIKLSKLNVIENLYNKMSEMEIAGLILPWSILATNIDPPMANYPEIAAVLNDVGKKQWGGLAGNTKLFFED